MDKQMVDELVAGLLKIVDEQLVSVILYGSVARGTASSESDVDVALLIKGSLSSVTENELSDFMYISTAFSSPRTVTGTLLSGSVNDKYN